MYHILNRLIIPLCCLLILQACEPGTQLKPINIETSRLGGVFTIDGQTYRDGGTSSAFYEMVRSDSPADSVNLGDYPDRRFHVNVINGVYTTHYYYQFGDLAPLNYREKLFDIDVQHNQINNIEVARIEITPEFTLNGEAFPQDDQQRAAFYLQSINSEVKLFLGYSNTTNNPVAIIPGEYSVIYEYQSGEDEQIPHNTQAVIMENLKLDKNQILEINVGSINANWVVYLNGAEFPDTSYEYADIYLTDVAQQDLISLGSTFETRGVTPLIPGKYQVVYKHREGTEVPLNRDFVLPESYDLSNAEARLFVDITSIEVTASFTLNNQPAPNNSYDNAFINLRPVNSDEEIRLGETLQTTTEPLHIIPAGYDIIYQRKEYSNFMPVNKNAMLMANLNLSESRHLEIDIPTVRINTELTLDGETFPNSVYDSAQIYIQSETDTEPTQLHLTHEASEPVVLLKDQYDLYYQIREQYDIPMNNHYTFIKDLDITTDTTISYDFKSTTVQFIPLLNGQALPSSLYEYGKLYLASEDKEKITLGPTNAPLQPIRLMQGNYRVYYEFREGSEVMPVNSYALVDEINIQHNEIE